MDLDDRPIWISVFGLTNVGMVRPVNQDNFLVADLSEDGRTGYRMDPVVQVGGTARPGHFRVGRKGTLLLVADGMGGAAAGGVASEVAVTSIQEEMETTWGLERTTTPQRFARHLKTAVERANERILSFATENVEYSGMGTTATLAGVLDGFVYLAQVGDSRAYLVRGGETSLLTRDQSIVQDMVDQGSMAPEEAELSRHRHLLSQALGTAESVAVDLTYQELRKNDVMVLCSDGLSGLVSAGEIGEAARDPDLVRVCAELISRANERGGPDNITVIAARFDGEGLALPDPNDSVSRRVLDLPSL